MTDADEVRAEYVETLARFAYETPTGMPWSAAHPDTKDRRRGFAELTADALAEEGQLPAAVESRVYPCDCQPCPQCEAAALAGGAVRQQRYVTAWMDVRP